MAHLKRATENIYADDANGVRRLIAAAGDEYDPNAVPTFGVVSTPGATPAVAPLDGYDNLSEAELLDRLPTLSADELAVVQAYERAHQARGSITRYGLASTPVAIPDANTPAPVADSAPDYDAMNVDELEAEIARRDDIDRDAIEGTGKDGNVVKPDLVKALRNA